MNQQERKQEQAALPCSVEEEADAVCASIEGRIFQSLVWTQPVMAAEIKQWWRAAIVAALLRARGSTRQDAARRAAMVASAESQNSNHVRSLSAEAAYEQACRAIRVAILADAGVRDG